MDSKGYKLSADDYLSHYMSFAFNRSGIPLQRLAGLFIFVCLALFPCYSSALTHSGYRIKNQSIAIFEYGRREYKISSNLVTVHVSPVYSFQITPDGTQEYPALTATAGAGSKVYFSYILTNTGNIIDSYHLGVSFLGGDFDPGPELIHIDYNGNGILDPGEGENITGILNISPNNHAFILVVFDVPSNAKTGNTAYLNIIGNSVGDESKIDDDNVNKTVVTNDASLILKKAASVSNVSPGGFVEYTLTVINTGGAATSDPGFSCMIDGINRKGILIRDKIHEKTTYVAGSLKENPRNHRRIFSTDPNCTAWTEALTEAEEQALGKITGIGLFIDGIFDRDQSAQLKFTIQVDDDHDATPIINKATVEYQNQAGYNMDEGTNKVLVSIISKASQVFIGPEGMPEATERFLRKIDEAGRPWHFINIGQMDLNGDGRIDTNDDETIDGGVLSAYADPDGTQVAGNRIFFRNTIKNASNFTDTLNIIKHTSTNLPEGWFVQFLQTDGVTSLFDTNGDGVKDTGPMAPGEVKTIGVRVSIPFNAPHSDNNGLGFKSVIQVISSTDPNIQNFTTDTISRIITPSDLWDPFEKAVDPNGIVNPGTLVKYTNTLGNKGQGIIHNCIIRDPLSIYLTNVHEITNGRIFDITGSGQSIDVSGSYDDSNHIVNWYIPEVPPGFTGQIYFRVEVAEDAPDGEVITNVFVVTSDENLSELQSNKVQNTVKKEKILGIDKEADQEIVQIGDKVIYTVEVNNNSNDIDIIDVKLTDALPEGMHYIRESATMDGIPFEPQLSDNGQLLTWVLKEFRKGSSHVFKYSVLVSLEAKPGIALNRADIITPLQSLYDTAEVIIENLIKIDKGVNLETVQIGDPIQYTIEASNISKSVDLTNVKMQDTLPEGFRYIKESSTLDGHPFEPEVSDNGRILTWIMDELPKGKILTFKYAVLVSSGARYGTAINQAGIFTTYQSSYDTAEVKVEKGHFVPDSIVIGKVFIDKNFNRIHDAGEPGVQGVRLYMEDGTFVITDSEGKYHIAGVRPGAHVLRLDESTLPEGSILGVVDGLNLCDPSSRLLELQWGTIHKANFRVVPQEKEKIEEQSNVRLLPIEVSKDGELTIIKIACDSPLNISHRIEPSNSTILIDLPGVIISEEPARKRYNDSNLEQIRVFLDKDGLMARIHVMLRKRTSGYPPAQVFKDEKGATVLIGAGSDISLDNDPDKPIPEPFENIDSNKPGIISPENGAIFISRDKITITVVCDLTSAFELYLNNKPVNKRLIGKKSYQVKKRLALYEYVSVALEKGENLIRFSTTPSGGKGSFDTEIKVFRSASAVKLRVETDPDPLIADGITEPIITISLLDENDVPAGNGSVVTIVTDKGDILSPDFRLSEPGHQAQILNGTAIVRLTPANYAEYRTISVISGDAEYKAELIFQPHLRDWIMTGIASGVISESRKRSGTSPENYSLETDYDGSFAMFLKGKLPKDFLLTTSYNSDYEDDDGTIFRELDPLRYYPVYGDETQQDYEAESREKLYLRLEKDQSYLMFGDYETALDKTTLAAYKRDFTGGRFHLKTDFLDIDSFAAYNDQANIKVELRGEGISGYYYLPHHNILENSEKVEIETRRLNHPNQVIKVESRKRHTDYSIDYELGSILFKKPIPSRDRHHNPVFIVVRYEVEGFKDKNYHTYGGRAALHDKGYRYELGATIIIDEGEPDDHRISGVDGTLKLFEDLILHAEYAESDTPDNGKDSAHLVELESFAEKAIFKVYCEETGDKFANAGMSGAGSATSEAGMTGKFKISEKWSIEDELYEKKDNNGSKHQRDVAVNDFIYSAKEWGFRLGGGYIREKNYSGKDNTTENKETPFFRIGGNVNLTHKTRLEAEHQYSVRNNNTEKPTSTKINLSHQLKETISANISARHQDNPDSSDDINIIFGIESQVTKSVSAFERYTIEGGTNGHAGRSSTGLELDYPVSEECRIGTSAELNRKIHGNTGNDKDFWALAFGFEYQPLNDEYTAIGRYEVKAEDQANRHLTEIGGTLKLNQDHTLFARNIYTYKDERTGRPDRWELDLLMGWAYRPVYYDKLNMISDLEIKYKGEEKANDSKQDINRFIYSLETHFQQSPDTLWEIKYACKYAEADYAGHFFTDLKAVTWRHTLAKYEPCPGPESKNRCFPVLFSAGTRLLTDYEVNTYTLGYGIELGVIFVKDLKLAIGYNFEGFKDRDFPRGYNWEKGPYFSIKWKFDESIFGIFKRLKGK